MRFKIPFILFAFCCFTANAQTQVPNGNFESWTLHEEGISGGGDYWIPDSGWHENWQNIATRFYNSAGYFHRYEESDANGYFKAIEIDSFVIMFSAYANGSCTKTLPIGEVITNDPNGYAVIDDLELVYDTPTSVDDEITGIYFFAPYEGYEEEDN